MKQFIRLISIFLILAVSTAWFPASLFHAHTHDGECQEEHRALEVDPCHLALFHHAEKQHGGCEHEDHLINQIEKCFLCKTIVSVDLYVAADYAVSHKQTLKDGKKSVLCSSLSNGIEIDTPARAPPVS